MTSLPGLLDYTEEDRINILKAYNKTEKSLQKDVKLIKLWLQDQVHLPNLLSDRRIETFLLLNKFSFEKTKSKIDTYFTIRRFLPEIYGKTLPIYIPGSKSDEEVWYWLSLPRLTPDLYRVSLYCYDSANPDLYDPYRCFAHIMNTTEIRLDHDLSLGDIYIVDVKEITVGHAMKTSPMFMKKIALVVQSVYSARIKGIHYINCPPFLEHTINFLKKFVSPKIAGRVYAHKDADGVHQYVPKYLLPKEYGGEEKSLHELNEKWTKVLKDYEPWIKTLNSVQVDESLRPATLVDDDLLGFYGTFKQLNVD